MLLWIILAVIAVVALILIYGLLQPSAFSVTREASYVAKPELVFAQINDFRNWALWSPWDKMDPAMQRSYTGASSGIGSKYAWIGNKKVGEGSMEITQSVAPQNIQLDLHFLKPFQADNVTEFSITPRGNETHVQWSMRGHKPLIMRVMGLVFNMDKIVGADFERGLSNLRSIVEK